MTHFIYTDSTYSPTTHLRVLSLVLMAALLLFLAPGEIFAGTVTVKAPADGSISPRAEVQVPAVSFSDQVITVKAAVSGANTKISWTKVPGATKYRVWRSTTKKGKKTLLKKTTAKCSFTDKKGKSNKVYYYHVRAFKGSAKTKIYTSPKFRTVMRVYVETGHGRGDDGVWDSGCVWNGYQEAKLMVPVARAMCDSLKKNGIYVYTDAYKNNNKNLNYTMKFIKSHSVSAFVNIHCDAAGEPSGTLPLYRTKSQKAFAAALNKGVHKYVNISDRGLCRRTDLKTLNKSGVAATCLFETGCIKGDNHTLRTEYQKIGQGLAQGLCDYFGRDFVK